MCYTSEAHPPIPVLSGAAIDVRQVTLKSADGTPFGAHAAMAPGSGGPGMVILPDIRGLHKFYMELADRFAERGISAVAFDYFGRTAPIGVRGDDFPYQEHVAKTKVTQIAQDVAAVAAFLKQGQANAKRPLFTVGFCFGGSNSWLQGMEGHGLKGVIGFYGNPTRKGRDGSRAVIERVAELKCPLLGLMGGADQGIPAEEVEKFRKALQTADKKADIHVYSGAPHSFFDRTFKEHAAASADAWNRVLAFVKANG